MLKNQSPVLVTISLACALLTQIILASCYYNKASLNTPLPQSYLLPNPPGKVWEAALLEALKPDRRILARDEHTRVLSWVNEVQGDKALHASLSDPRVTSRRNKAIAIVVVQVEAASGGSEVTIRLTYCSGKPFFGISSSRGNYEQEILRSIRSHLIMENASHGRN